MERGKRNEKLQRNGDERREEERLLSQDADNVGNKDIVANNTAGTNTCVRLEFEITGA